MEIEKTGNDMATIGDTESSGSNAYSSAPATEPLILLCLDRAYLE